MSTRTRVVLAVLMMLVAVPTAMIIMDVDLAVRQTAKPAGTVATGTTSSAASALAANVTSSNATLIEPAEEPAPAELPNLRLTYSVLDPKDENGQPYDFSKWELRFELLTSKPGRKPAPKYVGRSLTGIQHVSRRQYSVVIPRDLERTQLIEPRLYAFRPADSHVYYVEECGCAVPTWTEVSRTPTASRAGVVR